MARVFVTGGAGFIGSHLVDALIARGDEVICYDILSTGTHSNIRHLMNNPQFTFLKGDILDTGKMEPEIKECDLIFHLAASVGVKYIVDDPLASILANVEGSNRVFALANKYKRKIIFTSTSEVYGKNKQVPYKEDDDRILGSTVINRWSYSASKAIDEHVAINYGRTGLPVVILRIFNAYGPRLSETAYGSVIAHFIKQALKGDPITVHGDGSQSRSFTYIEDTIRGIIKASEVKEAEGIVFNIGNNKETRIRDLAKIIKRITGSKSKIIRVPYSDYYGLSYEDTPRRVPDITRAKKVLGFKPTISLEEGLSRTIEWWRSNYTSTDS